MMKKERPSSVRLSPAIARDGDLSYHLPEGLRDAL
jgi:hypothetical protein